jgi:hypothetical protein
MVQAAPQMFQCSSGSEAEASRRLATCRYRFKKSSPATDGQFAQSFSVKSLFPSRCGGQFKYYMRVTQSPVTRKEARHVMDNSDTRRSVHWPRDQRLSAARVLSKVCWPRLAAGTPARSPLGWALRRARAASTTPMLSGSLAGRGGKMLRSLKCRSYMEF